MKINMAASPKDKFEAAVRVIRGLPKNGSFQPSHDLMLRFYSYFKQATEGPCRSPKPSFWDVVNKRKWEAWSNLGEMQSEEAMLLYVDELKKIVETMPQTEAVTEFLQKLDNFYEMVEDSENHNTLKAIDNKAFENKILQNGSIRSNGPVLENGVEQEPQSSYRVSQLLKHDIKVWRDSSGVIPAGNHKTNGHKDSTEEEDDDDNDNDDDQSFYNKEVNGVKSAENGQQKTARGKEEEHGNATGVVVEEWEPLDNSRLSTSNSNSYSESESDTEEFCDTSDDPVELALPATPQTFVRQLPPLMESSCTSTPLCDLKPTSLDLGAHPDELDVADSMLVNASVDAADVLNLSTTVQLESTPPKAVFAGDLDILTCRGGEDQERDRRRQGGQGSRDGSTATSRGGQGTSGGATGGGAGGSGQRDTYPGPGGGGGWRGSATGGGSGPPDLSEQIVVTLLRLQQDMSSVLNRMNSLEAAVKESQKEKENARNKAQMCRLFPELSVKSAVIIFVWPLVVHFLLSYLSRRRRRF